MFELSLVNVKKYMQLTFVLKNINFKVYSGEKVGIVRVNGSGKSTILKLISGILPMYYLVTVYLKKLNLYLEEKKYYFPS